VKTLGRLLRYIIPYWWASVTSLGLITLLSFSRLAPAWFTRTIIDTAIPKHNAKYALGLTAVIFLVALLTNLLTAVEGYIEQWLGQKVVFDIRNQLYGHLQSQSMSFFDENQTGQLMSRVTNDVATVQNFLGQGLARLINTLFTMLMALVLMFVIDVRLTLIALSVLPLIVFYQIKMNSLASVWRKLQQSMADVNAVIQESVAGVKLVKAFGREEYEATRFNRVNWDMRQQRLKATKMMGFVMPGQEFAGAVSQTLILVFGASFVINHDMTLGSLVAFQAYTFQFWMPVRFIGFINQMAQQAVAAGARVFEILDTKLEVIEPPDAIALPRVQGEIVFTDVSFAYGKNAPLLRDISFVAPPGHTIALVGPSGSGKTTLANLLPRFYDPTAGIVTVDGIDVRKIKLDSLRSQIGMVMQETFLFNLTIRENIMYGRPDATMDDVVAAAKSANAHDFIMEFTDGYNTMVGEKGTRLSGGQRQRLAIARAILVDPSILILDEATSAVDTRTDFLITQALQKLMQNRTTIVIAHRIATVQRANTILVMDNGRIISRGTHKELLETSEAYQRLYELQFVANRETRPAAAGSGLVSDGLNTGAPNGHSPRSTVEVVSTGMTSGTRGLAAAEPVLLQAAAGHEHGPAGTNGHRTGSAMGDSNDATYAVGTRHRPRMSDISASPETTHVPTSVAIPTDARDTATSAGARDAVDPGDGTSIPGSATRVTVHSLLQLTPNSDARGAKSNGRSE